MNYFKSYLSITLLLILALFTGLPILHPGFFPIHDNVQVARVYEMAKALQDGQFPVRIVQDLGYGYGYPIFNFYAPLPYYIGSIIGIATQDYLLATKIMMVVPILIAGIGTYLFIAQVLGKIEGLSAAIIYMIFPYFAVNIYVRGAVGEYWAYSFLPFVFWGLYKNFEHLKKEKSFSIPKIIYASVAVTLVIISHNLSALMLTLFVILTLFVLTFFSSEKKKLITTFSLVTLLGFLISAFYSIPAVLEMKYTNVPSQIGGGADFKDHFVCLQQLWNSQWGYGGSTKSCLDGMSFRLGKSNIIFALTSIVLGFYTIFIRKKKIHPLFLVSVLILFASIFMTNSASKTVWDSFYFMKYLQYPWRFLNFAGFSISVLVAFLIYFLSQQKAYRLHFTVFLIVIISSLYLNFKLFKPQEYFTASSQTFTDLEYLRFSASKVSDEYLPKNFDIPLNAWESAPITEGRLVLINLHSQGGLSIIENKSNYILANVNTEKDAYIRANIAYFPAWKAFVDKKEMDYKITDSSLILNITSGKHLVEFKFIQTKVEKLANALSIIAIVIAVLGIIKHGKSRKYGKTS